MTLRAWLASLDAKTLVAIARLTHTACKPSECMYADGAATLRALAEHLPALVEAVEALDALDAALRRVAEAEALLARAEPYISIEASLHHGCSSETYENRCKTCKLDRDLRSWRGTGASGGHRRIETTQGYGRPNEAAR